MNISEDLTSFLSKNLGEVNVGVKERKQTILEVSISKADILTSQKMANILGEIHGWFMFNNTSGTAAYVEMEKYSNVFPYQFYATIPFEGIDPKLQVYVFQFTFSPKITFEPMGKVKERKSLWSFFKKLKKKD